MNSVSRCFLVGVAIGGTLAAGRLVRGQSASRALPESYLAHTPLAVSIELIVPGGTGVVGVEDLPPTGWAVSNVNQGGAFDPQSGKVKWGPFFGGSIPVTLAYDVTPISTDSPCFSGIASFDGQNVTIGGAACIAFAIPATSQWTMLALFFAIAADGSARLRRRTSRTTR